MMRSPAAIRSIWRSVLAGGGWLALAMAVISGMPAGALALPGAGPGAPHGAAAGLPLIRAAGCADAGPCDDDDGPPPRRAYVSRYQPAPAAEEPCLEDRRPARGYVYNVTPPQHDDPVYEEQWCGVRCWYRRLRMGYCGRGCDYYRFRLTEFQEGKLYPDRRYACRTVR